MDDLRQLRREAGLTQAELGRRVGVAQPNIAAYEAGRRTPSPSMEAKLRAALRPRPSAVLTHHRDAIVRVLARHHMTNPHVFGSVAAGVDLVHSDIDLLVDASDELDLLDLIDAANELEEMLGADVDIVTSRSLRQDHEIRRTAVPL